VLADELRGLGAEAVEAHRGGVAFGGSLADGYRACLWSRVASRVLMPLARFAAADPGELYDGVRAVDWTAHVGPERTLAVLVAGARSPVGPANFLALKTKDAIVDAVRDAEGARPSIDKRSPDVRVHVHVAGTAVTVSLDLAGAGLHRRGAGRTGAEAPLRETLAAALLRIAGWPERARSVPLYDPMCGTATLLVEAAGIALDVAPGLARGRAGVEGWRGHDRGLWERLREEARDRRAAAERHAGHVRIAGADASAEAVRLARDVASRAGFGRVVRVEPGELRDATPPWPDTGLIVTNPPYGVRLGEAGELGPLYEALGDTLKHRFPGWTAWVLSGNRALDRHLGLRAASRHVVWNGPIECRFIELPVATRPVAPDARPRWRRPSDEARGFARRLAVNARELGRWAAHEGVTAYRVYDSDVPEYNVAVDRYGERVRVEEYERPRSVPAETAERRLRDVLAVVPDVLGVEPAAVALRVRRRLGPGEQHPRYAARGERFEVREGDLRFLVNLTDYVDTGLFLDDRLLRRRIRGQAAAGRDFLNLFAYTCAGSVAAAAGGARSTTSVDLSRRYLDWGRDNFALNTMSSTGAAARFVRADAFAFLARARRERRRFDLAFVAPPTRSRSKGAEADFDVARDHLRLLDAVAAVLGPGGTILFATSRRDFELAPSIVATEITAEVTPRDFSRRPRLRAWQLR